MPSPNSASIVIPRSSFRLIVPGGTAARVIDLASPSAQPPAGEVLTSIDVRGRFLIGHTDAADPEAPILIPEGTIVPPSGAFHVDLVCRSCAARHQIGFLDDDTLAMVEHQPSCPELLALMDRAAAL